MQPFPVEVSGAHRFGYTHEREYGHVLLLLLFINQ